MNQAGIAIGINNLTATNGRVGVTWPFVVRKALAQTSIDDALVVVLEAELAGAHNYLLFDAAVARIQRRRRCPDTGRSHGWSESPWSTPTIASIQRLDCSRPPVPADLMKSSVDRLATASDLLAKWVADRRSLDRNH